MPSLRDLLEMRVALPSGFADDGETLLVLSNLTGTMQLYRAPRRGGELEQLTDLPEPVTGVYVPGTGRILLRMDAGGNERDQLYLLDPQPRAKPQPLLVEPELMHVAAEPSPDGTLVAYSSDRRNGVDFDVYVRPAEPGGADRCVFDLGGWCEPAGFSPDGRLLAVLRMSDRSGDNDLYLVDLASGDVRHVSPHEDDAFFGRPAWVAGGRSFLCPTNTGRDTTAIARYDRDAGTWEVVVESEWDLTCSVDPTGKRLVVDANEDGYTRLELRDARTLERRGEVPLPERGVVNELSDGVFGSPVVWSRDGRFLAYQFTCPRVAGDVWLHDTETGATTRVTESPSSVERAELVEPELHRFSSFDGESVPVFVYEPAAPDGPAPVVIMIHGGPEAQLRPVFSPLAQYFVSRGYAVAAPNVRGSTGYGKRFEHLDDVRLRLDSVRDLASLHDWLDDREGVDAARAVLYGGSYGGYMVLAGLAFHPDRWAAGIELVGISSLVTFLENTAPWRRAFREREYGSLEHDRDFLVEASPITHVDRIRAPLFIIHGANDPRVPLGEAQQIHRLLSEKGVPCELLVYDDEGHGLQKLPNRLDAFPRAAEFLDAVLGAAAPAAG
jgi:dipeptidyl aminopeptidase/acylaminoacyl peptidase